MAVASSKPSVALRTARIGPALLRANLLLLAMGCGQRQHAGPPAQPTFGPSATDAGAYADAAALSPRPAGAPILPAADSEIVLPFGGDAAHYAIEIEAHPGALDVQLSIDTTGSIAPEIDALQQDLERKIMPRLKSAVPSVSFGVAEFEDFPATAGSVTDVPYRLLSPITSDENRVASAVAQLDQPLGNGGDIREAGAEALWQIATGAGYAAGAMQWIEPFDGRAAPGGGVTGGVGFRQDALRVVLHVTDAPSHVPDDYGDDFPGTHDMTQAAAALKKIGAKLVAIVAGACAPEQTSCSDGTHADARSELEEAALTTGAVGPAPSGDTCPTGVDGTAVASRGGRCPLTFDVDRSGDGLSDRLIDGITGLVDGIRFDAVTGRASDDPIGFVSGVVPVATPQPDGQDAPAMADLLPEHEPDGRADSFVHVPARASLRFDVELQNRAIASTDRDQVFRVVVRVEGDGLILEQRTLRVIVPAGSALVPDGGSAAPAHPAADEDAGAH